MRYYALLISLLFLASCDNELDLIEDRREVPIVYGLLDASQDYQYIRVERAFADPEVAASDIALNTDSLYYSNIEVVVTDVTEDKQVTLEKIDGAEIGIPRGEGAFAQTPNYLYRYKTENLPIVARHEYKLDLLGISENNTYSATMEAIDVPFFSKPSEGSSIRIALDKSVRLSWTPPNNNNIETYNVTIFTNFTEIKDGVETEKVVEWNVVRNTKNQFLDNVNGTAYFQSLKNQLEADPSIEREFNNLTIRLVSGGKTVADYMNVSEANLGITSSGEIPTYTNIKNGLGIFGSKYTHVKKFIGLTAESLEDLVESEITKDLNFK